MDADPNSYWVVDEMMNAAEPRWGGSDAAMRSVAAYAQARLTENPVLGLFAFHHAFYEIDRMEDPDHKALAVLEPASLQVPNAGYLRKVGGAYLRKGEYWKAIVYLSQALRFSPNYFDESRFRSIALRRVGEPLWAKADAERAVLLEPNSGFALQQLGLVLRDIDGPAAAAPYFKRALAEPKLREDAFNNYCGALIDLKNFDEATKCITDLLTAFPKNPEGWRQKLYLIGFDAPESKEAMERFIALNDPERWDYHTKAAKAVRIVQAAQEGKGSPEEKYARLLQFNCQGRRRRAV